MNKEKGMGIYDIFTIYSIFLYSINLKGSNKKNRIIIYTMFSIISIYLLGKLTNINKLYALHHTLYGLILLIIPFATSNKDLLFIHTLTMILITGSRLLYNGCLIRKFEPKSKISNNGITKKFNWDALFPILGVISLLRNY